MFVSLQMTLACAVLAASEQQSMSLFRLFLRGGALMWVLLALSIIAIYIIGKKWWAISKASKADGNFLRKIREMLLAGRYGDAVNLCRRTEYAMARLVEVGIGKIGSPMEDIRAAAENRGSAEIAKLEKGLPTLATIAGGAPMIGFLGTVVGMVQAFFNMSNAGNNIDITMLSGGIYIAMVTTVGGLIVGIIAYFGYNYLSSEIANLVTKLEGGTFDFIEIVKESGNKPVKVSQATPANKPVQQNTTAPGSKPVQQNTVAPAKKANGTAATKAPENKANTTKPTGNAPANKDAAKNPEKTAVGKWK